VVKFESLAVQILKAKSLAVLPKSVRGTLRKIGKRGPQITPTKKLVSLRLSASVLEHYRATGPGWQTRIDEALKRAVSRSRA